MVNLLGEVEEKVTFACNLYTERDGDIEDVEAVFKAEFDVDEDVKDLGLSIVNVPTGQAQVKIHKSYLSIGLDIACQVLPQDESEEEEARCTKLEKYLAAVRWESERRAQRRAYSDFVWYFLARGAGVFKTLFYPDLVGSYYFPIRITARDWRYVYPVFGDTGPLFVVEKYERYVGDLKRELHALWGRKRDKEATVWKPPDFGEYLDTDKVEVVEYWDDTLKGLRIAGEWVWLMPHHYQVEGIGGIIPYSFAFCEPTPLADAKWMGRSVIAPLKDIIKQQSILMSKVATATELFYYPQILVETPHGEAFVMSSAPGEVRPVPPGSKVTVLNPVPNQALVTTLMAWYEKAISLFGLPEVMWGVQPGEVQAGYAIAMLQGGAKTKLAEKATEIEAAISRTYEHVLQLTEIFAPLAKGGFRIYPAEGGGPPLSVTADDVAGHYRNRVKITPELPQDQLMQWRIAEMARRPHQVTKLPLASDAYIREEILKLKHPDIEAERVLDEFLSSHPEIQEAKARLFVHNWMKEHRAELEKMRREMERMEERERKKAMKDMEAQVIKAYREAVERGEVPPELMPEGAEMPPEATGLPPEILPPSFEGQGPGPVPIEEVPERVVERLEKPEER